MGALHGQWVAEEVESTEEDGSCKERRMESIKRVEKVKVHERLVQML